MLPIFCWLFICFRYSVYAGGVFERGFMIDRFAFARCPSFTYWYGSIWACCITFSGADQKVSTSNSWGNCCSPDFTWDHNNDGNSKCLFSVPFKHKIGWVFLFILPNVSYSIIQLILHYPQGL